MKSVKKLTLREVRMLVNETLLCEGMKPVLFIKPSGDAKKAYIQNWKTGRDFLVNLIKAAGLTPGSVHDGELGPFGKYAEVNVEIVEYQGVMIGCLTDYEELKYSTGAQPMTTHFEVSDGGGLVSCNGKDLIYESPQQVIDELSDDLQGM